MKRTLIALGTLAALVGCNHEAGAPKADSSAVLANVNGTRITQAMLEARAHTLAIDPEVVRAFLTEARYQPQRSQLVHQLAFEVAMNQIAAKKGLVEDPTVEALLANQRAAIFAKVLVSRAAGNAKPTDAQLQAFYDKLTAQRKAEGQAQSLPSFDQIKANPQFVSAWNADQFQLAAETFEKDLKTQVPVTYAEGLQSPEAEY